MEEADRIAAKIGADLARNDVIVHAVLSLIRAGVPTEDALCRGMESLARVRNELHTALVQAASRAPFPSLTVAVPK